MVWQNFRKESALKVARRSATKTPLKHHFRISIFQLSHGNRLHRIEQSGVALSEKEQLSMKYEEKKIEVPRNHHQSRYNRGIKHDFPFINIRKVPREVLKSEGVARGFQPSRGTLRMLMNDKIMFARYYRINSAKHCENEENISALYFITSSNSPTRVHF